MDEAANNNQTGIEQAENIVVPEKTEKKDWIAEGILWYATPKSLRDPKTATKFCELYGVPESTFYYEFAKKENQEKIIEICFEQAKKRTPEVLKKLGEKAEDGDAASIGMYMDYVLEKKKKMELSGDKDKPLNINLIQYGDNNSKQV